MVKPSLGWTKLHWLCSMGSTPSSLIDLVALLYRQAITMPDNRYGDTPLHLACRNSQVSIRKPINLLNRLKAYQQQNLQQQQQKNKEGESSTERSSSFPLSPSSSSEGNQRVLIRNRMLEVIKSLVAADPRFLSVTTFDGIPPVSALYTSYIQTIPGYMAVAHTLKGEDVAGSGHFD